MRITHEADYAIRVVFVLASGGSQMSAKSIAEESGVTLRFTLKILRKLSDCGIVDAKRGSSGGYYLLSSPDELSVGQIIECIDGPFELNHCLSDDFCCTRVGDKNMCAFHHLFDEINHDLKQRLYAVKLSTIMNKTEV